MKVMLFAAGLGTRLRPLTNTMPKAMVPINNRPLIDIVLKHLIAQGATEVVVNVHHFAQQIIDYINHNQWPIPITISDETQELLNTGGGLRHAEPCFSATNSPILIHNVDILSNANLKAFYLNNQDADATLLVSNRVTQRYLLFDNNMELKGWTNIATGEVKSPYPNLDVSQYHKYAFSGIHLFSPRMFRMMDDRPNAFPIMDFYLEMCAKAKIKGVVQHNLKLMDVGKLNTLHEAEHFVKELAL